MANSHKPKPRQAAPKKLDPSRAAIYVAGFALIGTIATAAISKINAFGETRPTSDTDEISMKVDRYDQVISALEELAQALEETKDSIATENLSAVEKDQKLQKINKCLAKKRAIQALLMSRHKDYKAAIKAGDFVKAEIIQNEMDSLIPRRFANVGKPGLGSDIPAKFAISSQTDGTARESSLDSRKDRLGGFALLHSQSSILQRMEPHSEDSRALMQPKKE